MILCGWLVLALVSMPAAYADQYTPDSASSRSLTDYLHSHKLPLVGAQVLTGGDGGQQVVLYGFVATPFGKSDAEKKARKFLKDVDVSVDNRIKIRPELLSLKSSAAPAAGPTETSPTGNGAAQAENLPEGVQAYENQSRADQRYLSQQQQQYQAQNNLASTLIPLLGLGAMIGMGFLGGGVGSGFSGFGSISPYGGSSYGTPYYPPASSSPYP